MLYETFPTGDRGGNSLHVVLLNGTTQNLHAFWDSGAFRVQNDTWFINRTMDFPNTTALKNVANNWISTYGSQIETLSQILDPNVWAKQSFLFAQNVTYPPFFNSNKITEEYASQAFEVSKKRITLAGYRLANLVIEIYQKAGSKNNLPTTMKQILLTVTLECGFIEKPIISME